MDNNFSKNSILNKYENDKNGGIFFSLLIAFIILASFVFVIVANVITANGGEGAYDKLTNSDAYKIISYSISGIAILLAIALHTSVKKQNLIEVCRIKLPKARFWLYALIALCGMFLGLSGLNEAFINFLTKTFGYEYAELQLPSKTPVNFALLVVSLCLIPAVAEEMAFRGVIISSLSFTNPISCATFGGLMFSIFHMNPAQTPYQFCVGFMFTLLSVKSHSILPTVLIHFLNNFIIILIEFYFPSALNIPSTVNTILTIIGMACVVLFIVLMIMEKDEDKEGKQGSIGRFFAFASVGLVICLFMWIVGLK